MSICEVDFSDGGLEQGGHGSCYADGPHEKREENPSAEFWSASVSERTHHDHVPVNGHGGQAQDAAVKSSIKNKIHNLAENLWEQPPPDVVVDPEGKTHGENQVRDRQVEDEDVG